MTGPDWYKDTISIQTKGKGMNAITDMVSERIRRWNIREGLCFLFIPHTSASLTINENYDPSAQSDMEDFLERIAPEKQAWHEHTLEGADDSPAHLRTMLTQTSLTIPVEDNRLSLGSWQGIYLIEHRRRGHARKVLIRCWGFE